MEAKALLDQEIVDRIYGSSILHKEPADPTGPPQHGSRSDLVKVPCEECLDIVRGDVEQGHMQVRR